MKLQQLRYVREVIRRDLNISAAAEALHTSQPGVSRGVRQLEDELGVRLFGRNGRSLTHLTPAGATIAEMAERLLDQAEQIRRLAADLSDPEQGTLTIATTHTQARYLLPPVVARFVRRYPRVRLHLNQGTPEQVAEMAARGEADFALATEAVEGHESLLALPCYRWDRCILVPCGHPLNDVRPLTLEAVAAYPIVTYVFGFTGRSHLDAAFAARGLTPNVVLKATDADVIKTYVRLGLGVGIVAQMAFEPATDGDLCALDASGLFASSVTRIGLRPDAYLPRFAYDFIELFAPHLTRETIAAAMALPRDRVDTLFAFAGPGVP